MAIFLPGERRSVIGLGMLYAFRMLGLFMILPVLVPYGLDNYQLATPQLLGLALGAYGLSQALLQIPFGLWSDRWGRKPVIVVGLMLFALGSVIAALSESVYGLILGRFLQGGGAIAAAIMALVGDLTSDDNRTKAMAAIGASIGLSFGVALVLGPWVAGVAGLSGIFWMTALLAGVGLLIVLYVIPPSTKNQTSSSYELAANWQLIIESLRHPQLLRLNVGIMTLHFVLMATFLVMPTLLEQNLGVAREQHSWVYLAVLAGAFVVMVPFMLFAEKKQKVKAVFIGAVGVLGLCQLVLMLGYRQPVLLVSCLFLFFVAFNFLEANLPSLVSKTVPSNRRGTATGVYSTSQFFGVFLGGSLGGTALDWGGISAVFGLCIASIAIWLCFAVSMRTPQRLSSLTVPLRSADTERELNRLGGLPGVAEISYRETEAAAYLKVDDKLFQREMIAELES